MKVKKLVKRTLKDEYVSITHKHKEIYVGMAGKLQDEKVLNSKIKYLFADRFKIQNRFELCLAIELKEF